MGEGRKVISCLLVSLAAFSQGTMFMWNSFSLPNLHCSEPYSQEQAANMSVNNHTCNQRGNGDEGGGHSGLLASSHSIGAAVGALGAGAVPVLGPLHRVLPLLALAVSFSWMGLVLSAFKALNLSLMITSKFFLGFFITLLCSQAPFYVAEIAPEKHRPHLLSLFSVVRNLSQILVTVTATFAESHLLPWTSLTLIFGFVPAISLFLSGPFLQAMGHLKGETYTSSSDSVAYGIMNVTNFSSWFTSTLATGRPPVFGKCVSLVSKSVENIAQIAYLPEKKKELEKNYGSAAIDTAKHKNRAITKSTFSLLFFAASYIFSGMVPITNFPSILYPSTYPYKPLLASSLSLMSNFFGSMVSSHAIKMWGLKPVLVGSSTVMAVCMGCLSVYYHFLGGPGQDIYFLSFIPLILIIIFFLSLSLGVGTLFIVILGEKLPLHKRIITLPAVIVSLEILEALQNFLLPLVVDWLGDMALTFIFATHAVSNLVSVFVTFLWL